jgi:hypothetical protein
MVGSGWKRIVRGQVALQPSPSAHDLQTQGVRGRESRGEASLQSLITHTGQERRGVKTRVGNEASPVC